jgi:hypothetical protein
MDISENLIYTLSASSTFEVYCTPCVYTVTFRTSRGATPEPQEIIYLHKVTAPQPQVNNSYLLKN